MVKEEIFEGLKVALAKGETLQKAMMSFFNAGYSKEEIEEAARQLQMSQVSQSQQAPTQPAQQTSSSQSAPSQKTQPQPQKTQSQPTQKQKKPEKKISKTKPSQKPPKKTVQKVSAYEGKHKSKSIIVTGILIFVLLLLLGVLVAVFLFKDKLAAFFGNI